MTNHDFSEKKVRAPRTPKFVIEERYAIVKDLRDAGLTFDESLEVTGFPESQVKNFEFRLFKETKQVFTSPEGIFNLDKLLDKLREKILSEVPTGGIWKLDWDGQSAMITRHVPLISDELKGRIEAARTFKSTPESN